MKWLALLLFAGCTKPEPLYILTETIERDGVTVTRSYSGPTMPSNPLFARDIDDQLLNEP